MRNKIVAVFTLCAVAASPTLLAAGAPTMVPISCVSAAAPVRVAANVPADAASAKVYFKAAGQTLEYYSDMRRAADGSMWAFIPAPEPTTKSFTYRVVSTDAKGVQTSSALLTANTAASCPAQTLSADEQRASNAMIMGLTAANQSAVPTGFQCKGIVSYITASNELRPNDECRRKLAGAQPGAAQPGAAQPGASQTGAVGQSGSAAQSGQGVASMTAEESNRRALALMLGTAGLLGVGAVIVNRNQKGYQAPVSPSRP